MRRQSPTGDTTDRGRCRTSTVRLLNASTPSGRYVRHRTASWSDSSVWVWKPASWDSEIDGILDLGWGMNPDWVGRGLGGIFGAGVLHAARNLFDSNQI